MLWGQGLGDLPRRLNKQSGDLPVSVAVVSSVSSGASGMIVICAFVLLCGGLAGLMGGTGVSAALADGIVAVTGGGVSHAAALTLVTGGVEICMGAAGAQQLSPMEALGVLPFLLSFSGLSCILQVAATVGEQGIPMGRFLLSRPLHGLLTQLFAYLLLRDSCAALPTGLISSAKLIAEPQSIVGTLLLLAMCAMLFLTLETE